MSINVIDIKTLKRKNTLNLIYLIENSVITKQKVFFHVF